MNREEARKKAAELVNQMTVEEMASQLKFNSPAIERLGVPEYNWWNEALHGVARAGTATSFPQSIALGATFDETLLQQIGDAISTEGRAHYNEYSAKSDRDIYKGLTFWAPNINIFRDPRWGRGHETYGEDPYLTGKLGTAFVRGIQGEGEHLKAAACAKHFAVHSGPEEMRHYFNAEVSLKDMWETYLPAFEECITEGQVEAVMGAYNRTNGEPCCAHSYLMKDVLRDRWKFEGHFVSDCWAVKDFHENHKVTKRPEESVTLALNSGCDVNCGCTYEKVMNAYKEGMITEEVIKQSAVRLFTTRYLLGLFEETEYDGLDYTVIESPGHRQLAYQAAVEGSVLLKNNGILPLNKENIKTVGVIGPNADSRRAMIGNYYGTSSRYCTVLEGIQQYAGDEVNVMYSEGCHLYLEKPDPLSRPYHRIAEAEIVAEHSDVVVLCLGLDETLEGEEGDAGNSDASGDKKDLKLPEPQRRLLEAVVHTGTPVILCLLAGSSMDLNYAEEHCSAIMQVWYPGAEGGKAIADMLFGRVSPGGKMPVTCYRSLEGLPEFTDYSMQGRTYRYLEQAPLYPFGYGLNYGRVSVESASFDSEVSLKEAQESGVWIEAQLKNHGTFAVSEVLQVYIRIEGTENEVLHHRLCAFRRVSLQPGETTAVRLPIDRKTFQVVNGQGERVFEGSQAVISVGIGQPDARTRELTGDSAVKILQLR